MEIEHVVIRKPEFVAGSMYKPEVRVFVQTNSKHTPLDLDKLKSEQTVWMKWSSGPIVARSKILSWHHGKIEDGNLNSVRDLTTGTNLFGLDDYWIRDVSKKKNLFFVVVRLYDEEWLDKLIYPNVQTYGSSWIYLDNEDKKKLWLSNYSAPIIKRESERNIPMGTRFEVFRRDNFKCKYCGRSPPEVQLHVDHETPWKIVKKHDINNLVTACKDCNLGKGGKIIK